MSIAYGTLLIKKNKENFLVKFIFRFFSISVILLGFYVFLNSGYATEMINEAAVLQQDFTNNSIYTGKGMKLILMITQ